MAFENVLARLIAQAVKSKAQNELLSQYGPPSRGEILHDGLVGSGETLGGIFGTAAGIWGGEAIGGPRGAIAGGAALGPMGALVGGWGAHGAYLEGRLIQNILSHPENWTVDAAGAIVPMEPVRPWSEDGSFLPGSQNECQGPKTAYPSPLPQPAPIPSLRQASVRAPSGIPGLMASVTASDPSSPEQFQPPAGGLPGLIQEYMRNNSVAR